MRELFHADGDSWRATSDTHDPDREVHTIVFNCVSDSQRPYRVVEVPDDLLRGQSVDSLNETDLSELFGRSHTMDYSHDTAAEPESHGYGDPPF